MAGSPGSGSLVARTSLAVAALALAAAMTATAVFAGLVQERPATGAEIRQMRAAIALAVDTPMRGPLVGRVCFGSPRRCVTPDPKLPKVLRWKTKQYGEASFLRGSAPRQAVVRVYFERMLPAGSWQARAGGGYFKPLPCPVLRGFGRRC